MDWARLLHASDDGWAMCVGSVDADGQPWASRAWAVHPGDGGALRVAIDAHDRVIRRCLTSGSGVAVTAGNVQTIETIQVKGTSRGVQPMTPVDVAAVDRHVARLLENLDDADGHRRQFTSRYVAGEYVVCVMDPAEAFDQTPGPDAGAPLSP